MKNFDNITFVRWGNLNPRKHKESRKESAKAEPSFHVAPCFKGIYAFPQGLIEPFLLGGVKPVSGKIQDRCFYLRDENGEKIKEADFWEYSSDFHDYVITPKYKSLLKKKGLKKKDISSEYNETENELYIIYKTNLHKFEYKGLIWHHLEVDKKDIIKSVRFWNLTTYKVYVKALKKCLCKDKFQHYMEQTDRHGNPHSYPYPCSKDHFEVFIEKIK